MSDILLVLDAEVLTTRCMPGIGDRCRVLCRTDATVVSSANAQSVTIDRDGMRIDRRSHRVSRSEVVIRRARRNGIGRVRHADMRGRYWIITDESRHRRDFLRLEMRATFNCLGASSLVQQRSAICVNVCLAAASYIGPLKLCPRQQVRIKGKCHRLHFGLSTASYGRFYSSHGSPGTPSLLRLK